MHYIDLRKKTQQSDDSLKALWPQWEGKPPFEQEDPPAEWALSVIWLDLVFQISCMFTQHFLQNTAF